MSHDIKANDIKKNIASKLSRYFGTSPAEANREQLYKATALTIKDILTEKRRDFKAEVNSKQKKRVYYMCMEFLMGRSLKTNIHNLGLADEYKKALASFGANLDDLYEEEPDAGLGNGGLGRLAACFMDSLASLDYPSTGFSICYEYGLFKQKIIDGMQVELPDVWLPGGEVWLVPRSDTTFHIRFGGHVKEKWDNGKLEIIHEDYEEVEAVPYDMMVSGASDKGVARLRLWRARDIRNFNMGLFTQGQYTKALEESTNAEIISKVLYPSDNHTEGKLLRLSQQYFLVSASLQSILRDHMSVYGRLDNLAEKVAIHINDTHPALCIPELMRILMDEHGWDWDKSWNTVINVCSYTNHTVMPEALETWNEDLFRLKLPRIHQIVNEINERFCKEAWETFPSDWQKISSMSVIANNQVRMANLSVIGSHSVNGVSALHSDILVKSVFRDFYKMYPERITNVTNGIAHRRWLCYSNPGLSGLITDCIGDGFKTAPAELNKLRAFENDTAVLDRLADIKMANKVAFSNLMAKKGVTIDPNSLFDVQIKRLHDYKRQLLNALNIIRIYLDIKNDPSIDIQPQTFIFGAKAAPGYYMAKEIIKLLCFISKDIESHPEIREKLRVVFLEDYNVSTAEALVPSAEISEQVSLAGKEASGTGCMKLMMNGAITLGTYDGANVEMVAETGDKNMFIFGLRCNEVDELWSKGYQAQDYYNNNERLAEVIDYLAHGFAGESFAGIRSYLISAGYGISDPYMCLADFESYREAHNRALRTYADKEKWNRMSLINIAASGKFAADRSIEEYAQRIWHLEKVK